MIGDELSVYFENAARDSLGYEHVEGCLRFTRDGVELHFDERDRAFRKIPPETASFSYAEVTRVEYVNRWFRPKRLVLQTRSPEKLTRFPGAEVGQVSLFVKPESLADAAKAPALLEFKHAEAYLKESEERLVEKRRELESDQ